MELRQLRYFVRTIELGGIGRAARDLGVVPSALSQQLSRLETELSTRLLQRSAGGVYATEAGMAFYRQAQLALRHVDDAVRDAQQARLSGHVSLGMPPSASAVLALPYLDAMRKTYPDVQLKLVESLSTNLWAMLDARKLDLAILFDSGGARHAGAVPLVEERLYLIGLASMPQLQGLGTRVEIKDLANVPLVLGSQGLRGSVDAAFERAGCVPQIVLEIDGLSVLLDAVRAGLGATIQPGSSTLRLPQDSVARIEIADPDARRLHMLISLKDGELSPAALAARIVLRSTAKMLILTGRWPGATLHET
ncbi:LysR family transcriptional regulator [Variovorax rhizosphaerae]|uniref:LysR family transcriptional regulator n=1 Tax=Variovorax rhizosphaerae TaxID=1836200 RepID=A0ABU8WWD0_9BURK